MSIGEVPGFFALPSLPDWSAPSNNPLRMPLVAPEDAKTWKQGGAEIEWGLPDKHPDGVSQVWRALLHFDIPASQLSAAATTISRSFNRWRSLFIDYLELLTKQRLARHVQIIGRTDDLDLFCLISANQMERPYEKEAARISIFRSQEDPALTPVQFRRICELASGNIEPAIEYRLQLEAYRALGAGDHRRAIFEAAAAAEVALTNAIRLKFQAKGVTDGEKRLAKFRMLGKRLELAESEGVHLPNTDLRKYLVEPRNSVVHAADFADRGIAYRAIQASDELLRLQPSAL